MEVYLLYFVRASLYTLIIVTLLTKFFNTYA